MGFNDQEIVALSGAHALGRCHRDRSGFEGPWTFSPTSVTNEFFKLLFDESWVWKKWDGPKQLEDKKTKSLMMLPYVYCLIMSRHAGRCLTCLAVERITSSSRIGASRSTPSSTLKTRTCGSRSKPSRYSRLLCQWVTNPSCVIASRRLSRLSSSSAFPRLNGLPPSPG